MSDIERQTESLKELLHQINNSGKQAWRVGKNLNQINANMQYAPKYTTFKAYLSNDLRLSLNQAQGYIRIFENFTELDVTDVMLASHLLILCDISSSQRSMMIAAMKKAEQGLLDDDPPLGTDMQSKMRKPPYNSMTLKLAIQEAERKSRDGPISPENVEEFVREILRAQLRIREMNKKNKRQFDVDEWHGPPIISHSRFSGSIEYFPNQPLDEMGTVCLFCVIFPALSEIELHMGNVTLHFGKIIFVRQRFPDAKIECLRPDGTRTTLDIEFEFESQEYIRHRHVEENAKCHLIVCWDNTWKERAIAHPPILSLRETLSSGEMAISG